MSGGVTGPGDLGPYLLEFVTTANALLMAADESGTVTWASPAWEPTIGYRVDEMTGRQWIEFVHPDDRDRTARAGSELFGGHDLSVFSNRWVARDGTPVSLQWTADVRSGMVFAWAVNVTERAELEERLLAQNVRLEQALASRAMFLRTMTHELRTPLNAVLGFTGTMLMEMAGHLNQEQRRQLEIVQESGQHLLALINDILELSAIEAGQIGGSPERIDCSELLDDVARSWRLEADQKGLSLLVEVPGEKVVVNADKRAVKEILANLIENAIRFTDSGTVTLSARPTDGGGRVELRVADTGPGIAAEDLGDLFEPFKRAVLDLPERPASTGLGLYICRILADRIGGRIGVVSDLGAGSVFTLSLPAA